MFDSLDSMDNAIIAGLQADARQSTTALAQQVGAPRATVHERVKRLRQKGFIKGFTVRLDYAALDQPLTGFILVAFTPSLELSQKQAGRAMARIRGVVEVHTVTGEFDFLLKVRGKSMDHIGNLIVEKLRLLKGVGSTVTSVAFWTFKEE